MKDTIDHMVSVNLKKTKKIEENKGSRSYTILTKLQSAVGEMNFIIFLNTACDLFHFYASLSHLLYETVLHGIHSQATNGFMVYDG